jgi:hypothetical protein
VCDGESLEALHVQTGRPSEVTALHTYYGAADGQPRILSGHADGTLQVLEGESGGLLYSLDFLQRITSLTSYYAAASGRERLVVGGQGGKLAVYDSAAGELVHELEGAEAAVQAVVLLHPSSAPDSPYVIADM